MVVKAVEEAYSHEKQEVEVTKFLNIFFDKTSKLEKEAADDSLMDALNAVTDIEIDAIEVDVTEYGDDSDDTDSDNTRRSSIRPYGVRKADSYTSFFRIDV